MPPQPDAGSGGAAEPAGHRAVAHDDDASSNASSDYHEPHGLKEHLEHRRRQVMSWIRKNRVLFDFLAYSSFLIAFTVVAMEANPGQDLIEQVIAACCCCGRAPSCPRPRAWGQAANTLTVACWSALQNRAIKAAVAEQEFWANASHIRKDFYDIDAVSDFWNYLTPFVNVVLSESFPDKPGFFSGYFRILGLMRLRQVRVKKVWPWCTLFSRATRDKQCSQDPAVANSACSGLRWNLTCTDNRAHVKYRKSSMVTFRIAMLRFRKRSWILCRTALSTPKRKCRYLNGSVKGK